MFAGKRENETKKRNSCGRVSILNKENWGDIVMLQKKRGISRLCVIPEPTQASMFFWPTIELSGLVFLPCCHPTNISADKKFRFSNLLISYS